MLSTSSNLSLQRSMLETQADQFASQLAHAKAELIRAEAAKKKVRQQASRSDISGFHKAVGDAMAAEKAFNKAESGLQSALNRMHEKPSAKTEKAYEKAFLEHQKAKNKHETAQCEYAKAAKQPYASAALRLDAIRINVDNLKAKLSETQKNHKLAVREEKKMLDEQEMDTLVLNLHAKNTESELAKEGERISKAMAAVQKAKTESEREAALYKNALQGKFEPGTPDVKKDQIRFAAQTWQKEQQTKLENAKKKHEQAVFYVKILSDDPPAHTPRDREKALAWEAEQRRKLSEKNQFKQDVLAVQAAHPNRSPEECIAHVRLKRNSANEWRRDAEMQDRVKHTRRDHAYKILDATLTAGAIAMRRQQIMKDITYQSMPGACSEPTYRSAWAHPGAAAATEVASTNAMLRDTAVKNARENWEVSQSINQAYENAMAKREQEAEKERQKVPMAWQNTLSEAAEIDAHATGGIAGSYRQSDYQFLPTFSGREVENFTQELALMRRNLRSETGEGVPVRTSLPPVPTAGEMMTTFHNWGPVNRQELPDAESVSEIGTRDTVWSDGQSQSEYGDGSSFPGTSFVTDFVEDVTSPATPVAADFGPIENTYFAPPVADLQPEPVVERSGFDFARELEFVASNLRSIEDYTPSEPTVSTTDPVRPTADQLSAAFEKLRSVELRKATGEEVGTDFVPANLAQAMATSAVVDNFIKSYQNMYDFSDMDDVSSTSGGFDWND